MKKRKPPISIVYERLFDAWGRRDWWPGDTRLEVMVGAILTQNTAWVNVEKAILRLKKERALTFERLRAVDEAVLAEWIRPSGCFNLKARRLKAFIRFIDEFYDGQLARMGTAPVGRLREQLLGVNGIGPETADSILLYAFDKPVFVVDAYTRRFLRRHGWIRGEETYDDLAGMFVADLPSDPELFNNYHALIVELGKRHCKTKAVCEGCPLEPLLPPRTGGASSRS